MSMWEYESRFSPAWMKIDNQFLNLRNVIHIKEVSDLTDGTCIYNVTFVGGETTSMTCSSELLHKILGFDTEKSAKKKRVILE